MDGQRGFRIYILVDLHSLFGVDVLMAHEPAAEKEAKAIEREKDWESIT